ncbi:MAG TPA: lipopolysaccharide kinase InaA family protein [Planctomycetota bacterium]|nr:lipopolysaccharide kinase InaA family protein [Planctomycetota bacterium]
MIELPGFETVERGSRTVLVRPEWRSWLLEDLLSDFGRVDASRRRLYSHGRVAHFSYLPEGAPGRVFVRHATRGGLIGLLMGGLYAGIDRPLRELRATAVARTAGVSVPEPLAVLVTRVGGPFCRFTVISREVENAQDLLTVASSPTPGDKRVLLNRVADEMRRLHESGVYHADLTMKNILVTGSSVHIIDLDKATLAPRRAERLDMMNLSRLNRSIVKLLGTRGFVSRTDKLRFLRRYLGGRDRIKELSQVCAQGLWFHRLWWSMTGQA